MLYPKRGVSDLSRFTPAAVEEKYDLTPQQYPDFAALRGDPSDNLPAIPGVGEKTAAKWIREFGSLDDLVARADEVKGKAGETLRAHLEQVQLNRELTELIKDVPLPCGAADLAWASEGDRRRCTSSSTPSSSPSRCATGWLRCWRPAPTRARSARSSSCRGRCWRPGSWRTGWPRNASGEAATGVAVHGMWGRGTGDVSGLALRHRRRHRGVRRRHAAGPGRRDRPWPAGWPTRARQRCCTTPRARRWPWPRAASRWPAWSPTPRWRRTWRSPAAAPSSWSRWPRRCLGRRLTPAGADADQGTLFEVDGAENAEAERQMAAAHAVLDLADALRGKLAESGAEQLLTDIELPLVGVLAEMEQVGIATDRAAVPGPGEGLLRRGVQGGRRGPRTRPTSETRTWARPSSSRRCSSRAGHAQDQEDQDRLHHRRRRAGLAPDPDRAPVPGPPAAPARGEPAEDRGRGR